MRCPGLLLQRCRTLQLQIEVSRVVLTAVLQTGAAEVSGDASSMEVSGVVAAEVGV
jgi:hypothetical protein